MISGSRETIRVTKVFTFEMAHALYGHDGPCKNIHGHSYKLSVTIKGKALQENGHPKDGMIIDFSDLKAIVNDLIIQQYDHALVLPEVARNKATDSLLDHYQRVLFMPFQPSCENLLIDFKNKLAPHLSQKSYTLQSLRLDETATSYAEWHLNDNC
ncbi:MAG TPA: 6-carboxytetrahydropterin synthase [Bacteroidia bacterium]|nr:6-carboxytetrahydropterin synthase [Bacteroidia bacterium]HRD37511.1 6-carboxytetrahydropterin synthase [Bacteroidia bacterium]